MYVKTKGLGPVCGGGGGGEISRSSIGKDFTEPFPDPQVTFGTSHSSNMLLLYFETNVKGGGSGLGLTQNKP